MRPDTVELTAVKFPAVRPAASIPGGWVGRVPVGMSDHENRLNRG